CIFSAAPSSWVRAGLPAGSSFTPAVQTIFQQRFAHAIIVLDLSRLGRSVGERGRIRTNTFERGSEKYGLTESYFNVAQYLICELSIPIVPRPSARGMIDVQYLNGSACNLIEQFVWVLNVRHNMNARTLFDLWCAFWP